MDRVHDKDPNRQVAIGTRLRVVEIYQDGYVKFYSKEHGKCGIAKIDELEGYDEALGNYRAIYPSPRSDCLSEPDTMAKLEDLLGLVRKVNENSGDSFPEFPDPPLNLTEQVEVFDTGDTFQSAHSDLPSIEKPRADGMADTTLIAADDINREAVTSTPKRPEVHIDTPKAPKPDKPNKKKRTIDEANKIGPKSPKFFSR